LPTAEVYFDDKAPPPSVLEVNGADRRDGRVHLDVEDLLDAGLAHGIRGRQRTHHRGARAREVLLDYGRSRRSKAAAVAALNGPEDCIQKMRATYKVRRDALVESFGRAGWPVPPPAASMFAWVPVPEPFREMGSLEFSKLLVEKADVAVSPGVAFGEHGEGFVRIALVENEQRIRQGRAQHPPFP
jgi:alanine-synthesizing transaminase